MTRIFSENSNQGEKTKGREAKKGAQTNSFEAFHKTYQKNTTQTGMRT